MASLTAGLPSILVLACDLGEAGPRTIDSFISQIRAHPEPAAPEAEPSSSIDMRWLISNKYYTAPVEFQTVAAGPEAALAPAVIVLAPRSATPSAELAPTLARLAEREAELDVALLVSVAPHRSTPHTAGAAVAPSEESWEDIALEHGFEWVDVDPSVPVPGTDAAGGVAESGIGRVVAALHANLWESMVPAERKPAAGAEEDEELPQAGSRQGASDDDDDLARLNGPPLPEPKPYSPLPVTFPDSFLPSIPRKQPTAQQAQQSIESNSAQLLVAPHSGPVDSADSAFEDDFASFVPASATFDGPDFGGDGFPDTAPSAADFTPLKSDEHDEDVLTALEGEEDGDLQGLYDSLRAMREQARGLSLEERRAFAERAVLSLVGE